MNHHDEVERPAAPVAGVSPGVSDDTGAAPRAAGPASTTKPASVPRLLGAAKLLGAALRSRLGRMSRIAPAIVKGR
jgi:hypothetical protein